MSREIFTVIQLRPGRLFYPHGYANDGVTQPEPGVIFVHSIASIEKDVYATSATLITMHNGDRYVVVEDYNEIIAQITERPMFW